MWNEDRKKTKKEDSSFWSDVLVGAAVGLTVGAAVAAVSYAVSRPSPEPEPRPRLRLQQEPLHLTRAECWRNFF